MTQLLIHCSMPMLVSLPWFRARMVSKSQLRALSVVIEPLGRRPILLKEQFIISVCHVAHSLMHRVEAGIMGQGVRWVT